MDWFWWMCAASCLFEAFSIGRLYGSRRSLQDFRKGYQLGIEHGREQRSLQEFRKGYLAKQGLS
jgi:hypothetical protein